MTWDHFQPVTVETVVSNLKRARTTHSAGVDEVPMAVLQQVADSLGEEVTAIANAVLLEGRWPQQWKDAEVRPIWKSKGSRDDPKMYRPIAMLPAISRAVERIVREQLQQFAELAKLLPPFQHGFRTGHSTETAIAELIAEIGMLKYLEGTDQELHKLTHAHPTLSEVIKESAANINNQAIHF